MGMTALSCGLKDTKRDQDQAHWASIKWVLTQCLLCPNRTSMVTTSWAQNQRMQQLGNCPDRCMGPPWESMVGTPKPSLEFREDFLEAEAFHLRPEG